MDESIHLDDPTPVTVELSGTHDDHDDDNADQHDINTSKVQHVRVSIDKIIQDAETGNTRLVVTLPRLIDTAHAGAAVDLLLDKWDNYFLETLVISGVRFTQGGLKGIITFLSMQNAVESVSTLVFNDIIGGRILREDEDHVFALCQTLQNASKLTDIDLSHNMVGAYVWDALGKQTKLKSLCLSDVEMGDASFQKLQSILLGSGGTLHEITISNYSRTDKVACEALDQMLSGCRNLRSFSWENKYQLKTNGNTTASTAKVHANIHNSHRAIVPVLGLSQLSKNMFRNHFGAMQQLEITGGIIPTKNMDLFCEALEGFHKLQALKLSHCGLDSELVQRIVTGLRSARPPLSSIDFSHNTIDCEGASWIAQLSCLRAVTKNLRLLNLEYNNIALKGALDVIERFASKSNNFHLKLQEGNPFDSSAVFLSLASSKYAAETELRDTHKDCERMRAEKTDAQNNLRELLQAQSTMVNDMHELSEKAKQLEEDKDGLIKAFSVLGMVQHVKERDNILTRLMKLEEAVHGETNGTNGNSTSPAPPTPILHVEPPAEPTCLSKKKSRKAHSFDHVTPTSSRSPSFRTLRTNSGSPVTIPTAHPQSPTTQPAPPSQGGRSPRSGRPTTARHQLVKAASERWKSLMKTPSTEQRHELGRRKMPPRSKSSLAEFLNKSAPAKLDLDADDSISASLDNSSFQATPTHTHLMSESSSALLGDARRRMRQNATIKGLPPRNESSRSLTSAPPPPPPLHDKSLSGSDSTDSVSDYSRRKAAT